MNKKQSTFNILIIVVILSLSIILSPLNCQAINKSVPLKVLILEYHNILPIPKGEENNPKYDYTTDPAIFKQEIEFLNKNGYKTVTLKELYNIWKNNTPVKEKLVVLTFDDGDEGVYQYAYPILKQYNCHFVCFLITKWNTSNKAGFYMSAPQIQEMIDSGLCEIGGHTINHVELNKLNYDEQIKEIQGCYNAIKNTFNYTPTSFCYPHDKYNTNSVNIVKKTGFTMATAGTGIAQKTNNYLLLPRKNISAIRNIKDFTKLFANF